MTISLIIFCSPPTAPEQNPKSAKIELRQFGTSENDFAQDIAVDNNGNIYLAGFTYGSLNGKNAGNDDAFVHKYNSSGTELWTRQFGTSGYDLATSIALDKSGNVYVAGYTTGSLNSTNAGSWDLFIRKYNSSGTELWTNQFGTSDYDISTSLAVDSKGDVYMSGITLGSIGNTAAGSYDVFLCKYNSIGTELWIRQFGTPSHDEIRSIALDGGGNVYVAGHTNGLLSKNSYGSFDCIIRKYDTSGAEIWTWQFGSPEADYAYSIALDVKGNIYVAGETIGTLGTTNAGISDAFVRKYNSTGTEIWTKQFGTSNRDEVRSIAVDGSGNVYITGLSRGSPNTNSDIFINKYNSSGTEIWTQQFGTPVSDFVNSLKLDGSSSVYIAGETVGALRDTNSGYSDAFFLWIKW
jgi:hypothetical protein